MELDDKEMAAMRQLHHILKSFDQEARERITDYVVCRLASESERAATDKYMKDSMAQQEMPDSRGLAH